MSFTKVILLLTLSLFFSPILLKGQINETSFEFSLKESSQTSAGVYTSDTTLIRTLWSGINFSSGKHVAKWDGLSDDGSQAPKDNYHVKVLSHNVKYEWQGILANSSLNATGNDMHKPWDPIFGIRITGGKAYYCSGYGEGRGAQFYFNLSQPQIRYSPHELYGTNQNTEFLATDGSHVYWAGFDPFENTKSFVYATKVSDNSIVKFPNGVSLKMSHGITYQGVTDYIDQADSRPSGIAVQTTGDYLFVSHAYLGYIKVINKTTGQVIKTLPFVKPTALVVEGNYLWLCSEGNKVKKYPVNSDGSLGNPTISLPGLVNPLDMNIHGSLLAVVDGGTSQQVKTFNIATGTADWVHGQLGGNQNSPLVANDKFLFKKTNEFGPESLEYGSIAFEDDGSFWLCDIGNYRIQHFDSNRNFIENVSYLGRTYSVYVDKNDKKKLLAGFLEFEVSYDAPARDAAVLKYNWQENGDANYENVKDITTLSNGRTYGIRTSRKNGYNEHIVEFVKEKGIRETGVLNVPFGRLYPNGSLRGMSFNEQTKTQTWLSKSLLSFDGNNNPIYSDLLNGESVILADKDPQHGSPTGSLTGEVTSSGLLISFEGSLDKKDKFRLGGIKRGKFKFRTARTTAIGYKGDFPTDGAFDIGNYQRDPVTEVPYAGYAGNLAMVSDSNIVFGYHGEFWKQSQTNKYNHFHESGLFIGQLGEVRFGVATAPAGVAGNAFTPNLVKVNNDLYLLHGDESVHAGVHKWRISDLSTVQVQIATPTQEKVTGLEGVDLLEGLVRGQSLQNGLGWERDLSADYSTSDGRFGARIGDMSYGNYKSPDLSLTYAQKSGSVTVSRNLGDNKDLTAWKLFGKVNYGGNEPNESLGNGGSFVDVLDQNSKIIARFYMERDKLSGFNFIGNGQIIAKYPENEAFGAMNSQNQPFEISALDGTITIKYTNDKSVSTKVLADPNADWKSPSKLKFHFFTKVSWQYYSRAIDIHEMRFAKTEKAVIKTPQTLAFSETPSTVYASPNVPINATASSGLPVTLKVISGPGSIAGNTLSFGEFGKVTVQASQAGNTLLEAANATIEIVNTPKAVQTIEFSNTPTKVYATPAVTITALASSGLPLSLQVLSGSGSLDGNTLSFSGYGIVKVQATQTGTDTLAAVSDTIEITNS
ncbi:MAG: hypothetical protein H7Y07_17050, partial [Pyrinomonadaceae bacterium]|nr:hypothetical protein [Sphingobacteriaceae bacterium]